MSYECPICRAPRLDGQQRKQSADQDLVREMSAQETERLEYWERIWALTFGVTLLVVQLYCGMHYILFQTKQNATQP